MQNIFILPQDLSKSQPTTVSTQIQKISSKSHQLKSLRSRYINSLNQVWESGCDPSWDRNHKIYSIRQETPSRNMSSTILLFPGWSHLYSWLLHDWGETWVTHLIFSMTNNTLYVGMSICDWILQPFDSSLAVAKLTHPLFWPSLQSVLSWQRIS